MRDAQSNFDQVISFSGEKIGGLDVTNALGIAGVDVLSKTIKAIGKRAKSDARGRRRPDRARSRPEKFLPRRAWSFSRPACLQGRGR